MGNQLVVMGKCWGGAGPEQCHLVESCGQQTAHTGWVVAIAQGSRLTLHVQSMGAVQGSQGGSTPRPAPLALITYPLRPVPGSAHCYFLHLQGSSHTTD